MGSWIRKWDNLDIQEISQSLLVMGLLNAECFKCHAVGLSKDITKCPECGTEFRYMGFRDRVSPKDLDRWTKDKGLFIIDFDDFSREFKRIKARGFLG